METLTKFKEEYIFEKEKDNYIKNCKTFIHKISYKYKVIVSNELYRRIANYQIEKYGGVLVHSKDDPKQFSKRIKSNRKSTKQQRGLRAMTWKERKDESERF